MNNLIEKHWFRWAIGIVFVAGLMLGPILATYSALSEKVGKHEIALAAKEAKDQAVEQKVNLIYSEVVLFRTDIRKLSESVARMEGRRTR